MRVPHEDEVKLDGRRDLTWSLAFESFSMFKQHHSIAATNTNSTNIATFYSYEPQYQPQCIPLCKNHRLTGRTPHLVCIVDYRQVQHIDKLEPRSRSSTTQNSHVTHQPRDTPRSMHRYLPRKDYALHPLHGLPRYQTRAVDEEPARLPASPRHHLDLHMPIR
jgi:hypothetical protein